MFKNPQNLDYAMNIQLSQDMSVRIVCSGETIIVRAESKDSNGEQFVRKLVSQTQNFFADKNLKAKL